jgi:hypothetical protein
MDWMTFGLPLSQISIILIHFTKFCEIFLQANGPVIMHYRAIQSICVRPPLVIEYQFTIVFAPRQFPAQLLEAGVIG